MGLYNSLTKATSRGGAATAYDGHSITASDVLNGAADGLRPDSTINWTVTTPEKISTPTTATLEAAEQEELEAAEFKNAVANGIRVLQARSAKWKESAKLTGAHRNHLKQVAKSTLSIAASNKGLADTLQNVRAGFAQLGHSLDHKTQRVDHQVEMIKAKYQQRSN